MTDTYKVLWIIKYHGLVLNKEIIGEYFWRNHPVLWLDGEWLTSRIRRNRHEWENGPWQIFWPWIWEVRWFTDSEEYVVYQSRLCEVTYSDCFLWELDLKLFPKILISITNIYKNILNTMLGSIWFLYDILSKNLFNNDYYQEKLYSK